MAQLINITSEALQATIRRLLPSQQGFGEDLQASNVITPIIDLTPSAEGSEVRADLQTASSLGSNTEFNVRSGTTTFLSNTGFFHVFGTIYVSSDSSTISEGKIIHTDAPGGGSTSKNLFVARCANATSSSGLFQSQQQFDLVVFLRAGENLQAISSANTCFIDGSFRQIADVSGNLVNPVGFTPS